jgi:hypothetical protein
MTWLVDPPIHDLRGAYDAPWIRHALRRDIEQLTPSSDVDRAFSRANDRSEAISRFLSDDPAPRMEFLEKPPTLPSTSEHFLESNGARAGQAARLSRQISRVPLLLLDRVVDAVILFERNANETVRSTLKGTAVRLDRALDVQNSRMSDRERSNLAEATYLDDLHRPSDSSSNTPRYYYFRYGEEIFPFRVVVETDSRPLGEFLLNEQLSRWFGIGIDVAPASPSIRPNFHCSNTSNPGAVGGFLKMTSQSRSAPKLLAMTCAHVVNSECSLVWGRITKPAYTPPAGSPFPVLHEPDAALVDLEQCRCKPDINELDLTPVAAPYRVATIAQQHMAVAHASLRARRTRGYAYSERYAYQLGNTWYRAPSLEVHPVRFIFDYLARPFTTQFSYPGDSGSWVVRQKIKAEWLGMVVGDVPRFRYSYVVEAPYLLEYFERRLRETDKSISLTPLC